MKTLSNQQLEQAFIEWPVYMQRALDLAGKVLSTSPNPRVGCVIVNNSQIVAEGWHVAAGLAHAEVMALEQAKDNVRGGTAFVTLEPCSHTGKTGPCSEALIEAGIRSVVIAGTDPDKRVLGSGVKKLEQAGLEVIHLQDFEKAARNLNLGYFQRQEHGRPFVRLKLAMSLDGRTALANGISKWISSSAARADVQRLRAGSSAIITGINTVLVDDPSLNVRIEELDLSDEELEENRISLAEQPLRVILDTQLRTPGTARILDAPGQVKIYTAESTADAKDFAENVEIVHVGTDENGVDLKSMLESLASEYACNDVLIEAGSAISGSLLDKELVDELVVYIAPKILGSDAKPLFELTGLTSLAESKHFTVVEVTKVGDDIKAILAKV
ncbi:MAG: bifunctional diaminohydroxyphosphoribosylaminopyrimidine deaminase/5-amino-6-(5-phosphoribosylamino)uracil reductase RibD [Gammaproteobacteria bacterium]|nr:bifunctional diaminohydroxyphosphoribosylaminopyrimidine deaminase/5-amino-6-(5-phosphoribosylamino)uracil reductase RibD [Gammaproteobacteria bacterium]